MTQVQITSATAADADHGTLVSVTSVVTDPETGETQTLELTSPSGPTKVPELKAELGVPPAASLWFYSPHSPRARRRSRRRPRPSVR